MRILITTTAMLLAAIAAPASASWNVGGGTFTGTTTPRASDVECPTGGVDVDARTVGFAYDTVGTVGVGEVRVTGFGCDGRLRLAAKGTGPTGSDIDCRRLKGTYNSTEWQFAGECLINSYNTGLVTFAATVVPAPAGEFAGVVRVDTDTDRRLLYLD